MKDLKNYKANQNSKQGILCFCDLRDSCFNYLQCFIKQLKISIMLQNVNDFLKDCKLKEFMPNQHKIRQLIIRFYHKDFPELSRPQQRELMIQIKEIKAKIQFILLTGPTKIKEAQIIPILDEIECRISTALFASDDRGIPSSNRQKEAANFKKIVYSDIYKERLRLVDSCADQSPSREQQESEERTESLNEKLNDLASEMGTQGCLQENKMSLRIPTIIQKYHPKCILFLNKIHCGILNAGGGLVIIKNVPRDKIEDFQEEIQEQIWKQFNHNFSQLQRNQRNDILSDSFHIKQIIFKDSPQQSVLALKIKIRPVQTKLYSVQIQKNTQQYYLYYYNRGDSSKKIYLLESCSIYHIATQFINLRSCSFNEIQKDGEYEKAMIHRKSVIIESFLNSQRHDEKTIPFLFSIPHLSYSKNYLIFVNDEYKDKIIKQISQKYQYMCRIYKQMFLQLQGSKYGGYSWVLIDIHEDDGLVSWLQSNNRINPMTQNKIRKIIQITKIQDIVSLLNSRLNLQNTEHLKRLLKLEYNIEMNYSQIDTNPERLQLSFASSPKIGSIITIIYLNKLIEFNESRIQTRRVNI